MRNMLDQNPLGFALAWIGTYVVSFGLADGLSASFGVEKLITAPVGLVLVWVLLRWLKGQGLWAEYGLKKGKLSWRVSLGYLPLVLMASTNLWGGMTLRYSVAESVLYVVSMVCVGILEEVIFRGLLFRALCRENLPMAVAVSSITFGVGHIVNLFTGAQLLATLLQICYATGAGFLFTVLFLRSGSLIPCIATHILINSLSAFAEEQSAAMELLTAGVLTVVAAGYGLWIWKANDADKREENGK